MGMRFVTWNVWSFYRLGLLKTVKIKLTKCNLDSTGVQKIGLSKVIIGQQTIVHFSV